MREGRRNKGREVSGVEIIIKASLDEIAALVRETQERQPQEDSMHVGAIKRAPCVDIGFSGEINRLVRLLQAKDDTERGKAPDDQT